MPSIKNWTLTDTSQDIFVDAVQITSADVGGSATGYAITKRRLQGGLRDGVDIIEVDNGRFRFVVIPTRGMGLWRAECGETSFGWDSPTKGPVHPSFVPLFAPNGLGWLNGFDELLVRCGLESNGGPIFDDDGKLIHPLHGQIGNTPAQKVEVSVDGDSGEIRISGEVREARLFGNKYLLTTTYVTRVGEPSVKVIDQVTNLSTVPCDLSLLYHINFGQPLLEPDAKYVFPIEKMGPYNQDAADRIKAWGRFDPPCPGVAEACYQFKMAGDEQNNTEVVLHNVAADSGVSLNFNCDQLPCFTLWKCPQPAVDGYVTGLEPGTCFPCPTPYEKENGRVIALEPNETRTFEIAINALTDTSAVAKAVERVAQIQGETTPEICPAPIPGWSNKAV